MAFDSLSFIFLFLPIFMLIYFLVSEKYKNWVLFTLSLIFYAWGGPACIAYIPLLFFSIIINYFCALSIERAKENRKIIFLWIGVLWNIGILIIFKYVINQIIALTNYYLFNISSVIPNMKDITFPLGISFYTFKALTYIFDVYNGYVKATKSFMAIATYITMFPQIVAGPIVRYGTIVNELNIRSTSSDCLKKGCKLFIIGLAYKVILANHFAIYADSVFSKDPRSLSIGLSWLGSICYTLQIYFDFAGYSIMAIGLGKIMGFHTPDNFNLPYLSQSVTEFWRRWHITLSTWFKSYLYIPLGGNRKGKWSTYRNLFIVFLLCGVWHGANTTFLFWGIYHGFFLILERWFRDFKAFFRTPCLIHHIYLIVVIVIGWVIFRSESIGYAFQYLGVMFGIINSKCFYSVNMFSSFPIITMILSGGLCSLFNEYSIFAFERNVNSKMGKIFISCSYGIVFLFSVVLLLITTYTPFIYARF
jgi:alginate O-acetyltransferase complex protein AlgI